MKPLRGRLTSLTRSPAPVLWQTPAERQQRPLTQRPGLMHSLGHRVQTRPHCRSVTPAPHQAPTRTPGNASWRTRSRREPRPALLRWRHAWQGELTHFQHAA